MPDDAISWTRELLLALPDTISAEAKKTEYTLNGKAKATLFHGKFEGTMK